ncbi:MAG: DNA mismatch repair protein MutS [Tateyamaria sp.]|jgi:DNA-nicking Smr family endonuclease|nr:DNA mismatch repair protein MutS [Tateyamaria sp.]MBT5302022.1 DNA mismatch repair protein MutS [Tateyamaria sp.]MBT6266681.1 DNA mismatch repair protein MutS [Tateyamaria sp.]MBT6342303.1 DNA mismatch repair protein MutS [Tateyamaria sp.]MBT7446939.1 DNA mismatch repair protein MutS [Tateyamaria sp.]
MRRRRLRPDEEELWRKATEKTDQIRFNKLVKSDNFVTPIKISNLEKPKVDFVPKTFSGLVNKQLFHLDLAMSVSEQVAGRKISMDRKAYARLMRGKLRPEGKIDLHGMTLERAHPVLTSFILSAQSQGKRLVLVVTGKGKQRDDGGPIPVRIGVLRHQVPQWLNNPPLSLAILQVTQAHVRHGGGGAYYVYLKKAR